MSSAEPLQIAICMGSSCFARGNEKNLTVIEQYIDEHRLSDQVDLIGLRCAGKCSEGPNIRIGETLYRKVDRGSLLDLLHEFLPIKHS